MTEQKPQSFFLDEVLEHLTKLALTKKFLGFVSMEAGIYTCPHADRMPTLMNPAHADQTAKVLGDFENGIRGAVPYQVHPDTVMHVCGRAGAALHSDLALPFRSTWIDNPTGEISNGIRLGALLQDKGLGLVQVTLVGSQPQEAIGHADLPPLRQQNGHPLLSKLWALPERVDPVLIVPMSYDRKTQRVSLVHGPLPMMIETDRMKSVIDYNDILASGELQTDLIREMFKNYRQAAAVALLLAQAITRKEPDLKLGSPHKPSATSDSLQLQAGKVPKRKAALVTVDLKRTSIPEHPEEHSHLADYRKVRHWVQTYQYTKKDGRLITVPEHERWKASSPFPAPRKAHFVKGDPSL